MTHRHRHKSKPNRDDWRLQIHGLGTQPESQRDLIYMLRGGERMKAVSSAMEKHPPHSRQDIIQQFYRMGKAAHIYGVKGMFYNNGISVPIDSSYLPAEARALGISSTRELAEGLAVKHLDTPDQMALALSAYEAGARGNRKISPVALEFENSKLAHLSEQKIAVTHIRAHASTLKHLPHVSPEQAAQIGYAWGQQVAIVGKDRFVHYSKLSDPEDRVAARTYSLDTPIKLAEGAMLSKVDKQQASPQAFAAFQHAFEQGLTGQRFRSLAPLADGADIAPLIQTTSLKKRYEHQKEQVAKAIEGGLKAVELSGITTASTQDARAAALQKAQRLVHEYGKASLVLVPSASAALPAAYQDQIKQRLAAESPEKAQQLTILEGAQSALVQQDKTLAQKPALFSPTGLLEASLTGALMEGNNGLKASEAASLLATYRQVAQDSTPTTSPDGKLQFSNPAIALLSGTLGDAIAVGPTPEPGNTVAQASPAPPPPRATASPSAAPVATATDNRPVTVSRAATQAQQAEFIQTLRELRILNNGRNDDMRAARSLQEDGLLDQVRRRTIDQNTSRALAAQGLQVANDALADGLISAQEAKAMQQVRDSIAEAFRGHRMQASDVSAPQAASTGEALDQTIRAAEKPRRRTSER